MAVVPRSYPTNKGSPVSGVPIGNEGPRPFFPPVKIRTHWDPTMVLRHTLPQGHISLPMDPRPWTRINMEYTTAGEEGPAPSADPSIVLPPGGANYPPNHYLQSIDDESQLRRLDRALGTAEASQYIPHRLEESVVPTRHGRQSRFVSELESPQVLLRSGPYPCREEADLQNLSRSPALFNNATKQDRYKQAFTTKMM